MAIINDARGIREYTPKNSGKAPVDGTFVVTASTDLATAVKQYFVKNNIPLPGAAGMTQVVANADLTSSAQVVEAVKSGKIAKVEAIRYAEKFQLVTKEDAENLTPVSALKLLEANLEEEDVMNEILGQVAGKGDKVKYEDNPSPAGSVNVKNQIPSTMVSNESSVNTSKREDFPKPDGKVAPEKMMSHDVPSTSNVNDAKTEDQAKPTVVGQIDSIGPAPVSTTPSSQSNVNTSKTEDQPTPKGTENFKGQLPSTTVSSESDVNKAKSEDQPTPKKGQMIPPMPSPMGDDKGGMPKTDMPKPDMPKLPSAPKEVKEVSEAEKIKDMSPADKAKEAGQLLIDLQTVLDDLGIEFPKRKKEPAPKAADSDGPKDGPKPDKPKDDSKVPPFMKKDKDDGDKPDSKPKDLDDKPKLPPAMSYKVELVKDEKSPVDSYHVVSLDSKPLFSVSARQAYGSKVADYLADFQTQDYCAELTKELNAQGALATFKNVYASKGTIVTADGLPDQKSSPEPQAKPMNLDKGVSNTMSTPTQHESYSDMLLEVVATTVAASKGSAQEVVDQLRDIFSNDTTSKEWEGRLSEKVNAKRTDMDKGGSGDSNGAGAPPDPYQNAMSPNDVKAMISKLAQIKVMLPELKKIAMERDELKAKLDKVEADAMIVARTTATLKIAEQKAQYKLIDSADIKTEAIRLAKLKSEELEQEVKELKNSIKIAKEIVEKSDYSKVERTASINDVTAAIPSQQEVEVVKENKAFKWSVGAHKYN